jgi:hypothetical protein
MCTSRTTAGDALQCAQKEFCFREHDDLVGYNRWGACVKRELRGRVRRFFATAGTWMLSRIVRQ